MPGRAIIPQALTARLTGLRHLQTTAPLPPPTTSLPPVAEASSSKATSVPTTPRPKSQRQKRPSALSLLPPIIPYQPAAPIQLPTSVSSAINLLKTQSTADKGIYLIARLHSRSYLLHPRDIITLPTLQPLQSPGTTLKLTRISEVGCRDYAIRAPSADGKLLRKRMDWDARELPNIPTEMVECELTVLEHTRSPVETRFKMKRRKGYRKTIRAKHGWTRLRVGEIKLKDMGVESRVVLEGPRK